MPKKVLEDFTVEWIQVMDENGNVDKKLMPKLDQEDVLKIHQYMVLSRVFDDKIFKLQRQGRMGTYGQSLGQEASAVGTAYALKDDDWSFPAFRENGMFITRKFPMVQYMQYWGGDERGAHIPAGLNIFTFAIPVGTQIPHAVGLAWAMKLKKKKAVSMVYFGDGATSKGDFHEGMNFAGTFKLPCIFVCQNNQWAISLPVTKQTAAQTLAQKAIAYGFPGIRVDGNDVFAVYAAAKEAVENARNGNGPTLIECFTYRVADHTTSDDARRYRTQQEVDEWKKKDPITRLEKYIISNKLLAKDGIDKVWADASAKAEEVTKEFEAIAPANPEDMFKHVYATVPAELQEQLEEMKQNLPRTSLPDKAKDDKDHFVAAG